MANRKFVILLIVAFLAGDVEGIIRSKFFFHRNIIKLKERVKYLEFRSDAEHECLVSIIQGADHEEALGNLLTHWAFIDQVDIEL